MNLLQSLNISATGLNAHRTKMNVIAENLANSETTRTAEGGPYRRKMVVLESVPDRGFRNTLDRFNHGQSGGVAVSQIVQSPQDFHLVYQPNHPDANAEGYVAYPNVDLLTEMADMIVARRAYDANATAIADTKSMILKALEIGR
jgi:flagellar basal-body rod protein FlgC